MNFFLLIAGFGLSILGTNLRTAAGFLTAGFLTAGFLAAGFLAAGFLAAGFFGGGLVGIYNMGPHFQINVKLL